MLFRRLMMAQRRAGGSGIPTNQIWYESSNGESVTPYSTAAFGRGKLVSNTFDGKSGVLLFSERILEVGDRAFFYCKNISAITLPDTVSEVGPDAFYGCYSLINVNLPKGITSIGDSAFSECSFSSFILPIRLLSIGEGAFSFNKSLREIEIPRSVRSIGDKVFKRCTNLKYVRIKSSTPPILGVDAFPLGCQVWIPQGSLASYSAAPNWSSYKNYFDEY